MNLVVASRSGRICVGEKKTGTGEAGFGFLEFGDVQRCDVEATRLKTGARSREGSGENDGAFKREGVGGVRLGRIDVYPLMASEGVGIEPGAVGKEVISAEIRDRRFEMKTAGDGNGDYFIVVRRKNCGELADTFGVAAPGEADEEFPADAQNIAAFECARQSDVRELSKLGKGLRERGGLAAAGFRSERQDHGQFIENDGGVFHEHRVRKIGLGGKRNHTSAQFGEKFFVSVMLPLGGGQIDGPAIDEGKFAMDDGGADAACDGCEHSSRESLHENEMG